MRVADVVLPLQPFAAVALTLYVTPDVTLLPVAQDWLVAASQLTVVVPSLLRRADGFVTAPS